MIDAFVSVAAWFVVVAIGVAFIRWLIFVGSGPRRPRRYWKPRIRNRW